MRVEHMLPMITPRAIRLVHRARPLCTAPSCLYAMFTLTFVFTNTHDPRYPWCFVSSSCSGAQAFDSSHQYVFVGHHHRTHHPPPVCAQVKRPLCRTQQKNITCVYHGPIGRPCDPATPSARRTCKHSRKCMLSCVHRTCCGRESTSCRLHKRVRGSVSKICFFVVHTSSFSHIFLHAMLTLHVARSLACVHTQTQHQVLWVLLPRLLPSVFHACGLDPRAVSQQLRPEA
jgi:hypothetical protein